eukprot:CAMPEP_0195109430 /NCGR_PEP_ID=MMETSP0448-20130528/89420_1 /TAXON_ID=66468 /ORGANISM="Heterocapsa triquestra, Strain CCMP 448" /LENGTH=139 /DNA_ID=CAMNT_0040146047 /DNA_START=44 /DNA_END=460 /DNA_ORIENTATION=+
MAAALMQQGSKGAMRDLDYINPRPKAVSSALPPEVRAKLGLSKQRASSCPPSEQHDHQDVYTGARNAAPKVGQSGAGTDWQNPNGHAFVRKGSGMPMSQRASRKAQMEKLSGPSQMAGYGAPPARTASRERRQLPPVAP